MHNEKLIKGLYDYREEHDACGIGFYANMDNKRSHDIIDKSLEMLRPQGRGRRRWHHW